MRMKDFRGGEGVAEVAGIEGDEGVVAIGPGEAAVRGSSDFIFILFYFY